MENEEDQRRIRELESSLAKLTLRLEALEAKVSKSPPPVPEEAFHNPGPPPILPKAPEPARATVARPPITPNWFEDDQKTAPIPKQDADAIEYKWGINGLLRGGRW